MLANRIDLTARMTAVQPKDTALGLFFTTVFSLIEQQAGPQVVAQVRSGELAKDYSELRMYPLKDFLQLIFTTAEVLEGYLGSTEAVFRACGEHSMNRYQSGPGRFLFSVVARGDPHKLFSLAQIGYSTAVNYGRREYKAISPKSGVLQVQGDVVPPAYHEGVILGALKVLKLEGRARSRALGLDRAQYDITWQ